MNNPFKAYDVRGVFNKELLPSDMLRIGLCAGDLIKQDIVIGGDVRTSTQALKNAFISGYLSTGYDIIDIGTIPTPVINYYGFKHGFENCVITGSHTGPGVNGVKFFNKLGVAYNKRLRKIEEKYLNNDFARSEWQDLGSVVIDNNAVSEYVNNIKNRISLNKRLRIVLDHGNGTTGLIAPRVLESIGCEVININKEPDGRFPNRESEPRKDNLNFLKKRVKELNADFGCGFDGDGDRSVFVDNEGRVVDGSLMTCFFAKNILEQNENAYIVATLNTSSALNKVVDEFNGNLVWCAVGLQDLSTGLLDNNAMFASETSGHFYFNDFYSFSDGILACAITAEFLSNKSEPFSELIDEFPEHYIKHDKFRLKSHEEKFRIFEQVKQDLSEDYELNTLDGVKLFINDADWVLIRPSNTEPVIRITIECSNEKDLNKNTNLFLNRIRKFL